jgi:biopolymer transport protein ExbD
VAGGTLKSHDDDESISEINIIPLVDIVLVLLIIFMVTAQFLKEEPPPPPPPGIEVELPAATTGNELNPSVMSITINKDNLLFLNGERTDNPGLERFVRGAGKPADQLEAVVAADKRVSHGDVIAVVDFLRTLGVVKFAVNTKPQEIR